MFDTTPKIIGKKYGHDWYKKAMTSKKYFEHSDFQEVLLPNQKARKARADCNYHVGCRRLQ